MPRAGPRSRRKQISASPASEFFADLSEAEPYWRVLEEGVATPYQRYDFLKQWQCDVGGPSGVTPCIVVGFNAAGELLFLWPFGRRRIAGCQAVEFLGGNHTNCNMGLRRCGDAASPAPSMRAICALRLRIWSAKPTSCGCAIAELGRQHQSFRFAGASTRGQLQIQPHADRGFRCALADLDQARHEQDDA